MRVKWDAVKLALASLSVALGGVLLLGGLTNAWLALRGEEGAPGLALALAVTLAGAALLAAPLAWAWRSLKRGRDAVEA